MDSKTLTLAHYYTAPEVQQLADHVADSLELSLIAQREKADRIVFAGVRFMAETAKILNPQAQVILPDSGSTCSLVEQTDINALRAWREQYADHTHVSYINCSAEHKALSDWIVTSRNVDDIVTHLYEKGEKVIFSPDRNMGNYLNYSRGFNMPVWSAVCEVHDKFNESALNAAFAEAPAVKKYLIAHPESPLPVLKRADLVGSTSRMLKWVENFSGNEGIIYVATEEGLLYNMRQIRGDLDIRQAPIYAGCQCNQCPYMKLNTVNNVLKAQAGVGTEVNYLTPELMDIARKPIVRMLEFSEKNNI